MCLRFIGKQHNGVIYIAFEQLRLLLRDLKVSPKNVYSAQCLKTIAHLVGFGREGTISFRRKNLGDQFVHRNRLLH